MKILCPQCRVSIALDDVNVAEDVASCRTCRRRFGLADALRRQEIPHLDIARPPRGTWHRRTESGFELAASLRSGRVWFFIPFTLIMAGVGGGLVYAGLGFGGYMFAPFVAFLALISVNLVAGKLRVQVDGDHGTFTLGLQPLAYTRKFRWSEVRQARRVVTEDTENGERVVVIELVRQDEPIRLGSWLTPERFEYVLLTLQNELEARRG